MLKHTERVLDVGGKLIDNGIQITVRGRRFVILFPPAIWRQTPVALRQVLLENLVFGNTHYLGVTWGYDRIRYSTRLPCLESLLFRNQAVSIVKAEKYDKVPPLTYLRQFFNLQYDFAPGPSALPFGKQRLQFNNQRPTAVLPFTFGKESLVTFALCRELGITPVVVYSQEPSSPYEEPYKKKQLARFKKEFGVATYFVTHEPGLFRYDAAFGDKPGTEIGWGSQTTLLSWQMVPFVLAHRAQYILFGSEYLNNEYEMNEAGWRVQYSYDQSSFFTMEQDTAIRFLTDDNCRVRTSLEPLEETSILFMLHRRYPDIGKYQFSCTGEKPLYGGSQWCHKCYKCWRMFLIACAVGIDPYSFGFKKDILQERGLFTNYFGEDIKSGSNDELDFCFYALYKKKWSSPYVELFQKQRLPRLKKSWAQYRQEFTTLQPHLNLPDEYKSKLLRIFKEELSRLARALPR